MSEDANQSIMIVTSDIWLPPPPKGPNDLVHIHVLHSGEGDGRQEYPLSVTTTSNGSK